MKKIFTLLLIGFMYGGFSQSPFLINYQGVARDGSLNPISSQNISLKFEVLQGSVSGSVIYTDMQVAGATTNSLGLFTTQIGKNGTLGQVNWQSGPYFLQVSMDIAGGSSFVTLGTPQQIVSVPFSMHSQSVPSSYNNNILTIGSKTHAINSGTVVTLTQGTGTNITVSAGPDYTISYAPPILALTSNNASISIVGSNAVALPASITPTISTSGIATVTNGAYVYTVSVPSPSYNQVSGVLSFGANNTVVTPTLGMSGGVLYSGPFSNSVAIPNAVTVSGTGLASVTGGPANYLVNVPSPSLAMSSNNLSLSIVGSNSVALPPAVTIAQTANNIIAVTGGPTNYTVGMPTPIYTGTALILGSVSTTIAPTLTFNSGTLTSGVASNSVDISGAGPFKQAGTSVTLTTVSNSLAIGTNAASAKLDVTSNGGTVLKVTDIAASNTSPAAVVSSSGVKSLFVSNNSTSGVGGDFNASGGLALTAQNSSTSFPTFQAQNTSGAPGAYAANFIGGLTTTGNGSTSSDFALRVSNTVPTTIFAVRNDGNVGIGTASPTQKLDVAGSVKITDGTQGVGKVLTSDASGNASWQPISVTTATTFSQQFMSGINLTPTSFSSALTSFTKVNADTKIKVILQTHIYVDDLIGTNGVTFEIRLNNTITASGNSGKTTYFIDNNGAPNFPNCKSVTMIAEFIPGALPAGSYSVNMFVNSTGVGIATGAWIDIGNFGTNSLIIDENR
ncbi:beta strand repeat-containing protein [Aurantibacillus circumpalustris]|uniref:beta strand repeat-containing protein n=1 Tax=Aurantibacillus circumpalustris TaxID=3036359 RepID=UPI00295B2A5D|nr:hypothetical protein [Aurantibacillus circumpalustris]